MSRLRGLLLLPFIGMLGCNSVQVERRGAPQQRVVSRAFPAEQPVLRQALLNHFKTSARSDSVPFGRMNVIELKPPNYPPDWVLTWADPGGFLAPYKQMEGRSRAQDLLIEEPTGDLYWPSEYAAADGPARFQCGFILHFEPRGPGTTEVQVYEKVPVVWPGEHWALLHEGIGFGKVHDIRMVEPTVRDRQAVLDAIAVLKP